MGLITNILFPVDFSSSCVAMAAYVKRAATLLGAKVSLAFAAAVSFNTSATPSRMRASSIQPTRHSRHCLTAIRNSRTAH